MTKNSRDSQTRTRTGSALIRFSGMVLAFSSLVKFAHLAKPVAYMSFLGYADGKVFLIAGLEMLIAILLLRHATRAIGPLLASSYFGGAIAAHVAAHPLNSNAPIVVFNFHHPYLGALPAVVVLASAWIGVYLRHPEALWSADNGAVIPVRAREQSGATLMHTAAWPHSPAWPGPDKEPSITLARASQVCS